VATANANAKVLVSVTRWAASPAQAYSPPAAGVATEPRSSSPPVSAWVFVDRGPIGGSVAVAVVALIVAVSFFVGYSSQKRSLPDQIFGVSSKNAAFAVQSAEATTRRWNEMLEILGNFQLLRARVEREA